MLASVAFGQTPPIEIEPAETLEMLGNQSKFSEVVDSLNSRNTPRPSPSDLPETPPESTELGSVVVEEASSLSLIEGAANNNQPMISNGQVLQAYSPRQHTLEIDLLTWWISDRQQPTLLVGNSAGTPIASIGNLTDSSSQILLGQERFAEGAAVGLRLRGKHQTPDLIFSRFDWSLFHLFDQRHDSYFTSTDGSPILSRPFENQLTGSSDAQIISYPGLADGTLDSDYRQSLTGGEALASFCLYGNNCRSLELVAGYQFFRLRDALYVQETLATEPSSLLAPGTRFEVRDEFEANNDYHLLPVGLRYTRVSNKWYWNARALVALGFVNQTSEIYGYTNTYVQDTQTSAAAGGFLALPPILGRHSRAQFAWVPQLELQGTRRVSSRLSVTAGYSLLFFNQAAQVADQIPTSIHPGHLPPVSPTAPTLNFDIDDQPAFVHGMHFGMMLHF
ncbi:MAG: BBP7 family outer membrane beta-barrel protein [Pirellulaceae bacterium]